jgi:hypothetical protein
MPTIAFLTGWSEGPWHTKRIEKKLAAERINKTEDKVKADILFCHSTGCYLIPENARAKVIILVGLPYWPGRSLVFSGIKKLKEDFKYTSREMGLSWWANKTAHTILYMLKYPKDTVFVKTKHKVANLPDPAKHKIILVRNEQDDFCHPKITKILDEAKEYQFLSLPGEHDDCWMAKQPYIDLIKENL